MCVYAVAIVFRVLFYLLSTYLISVTEATRNFYALYEFLDITDHICDTLRKTNLPELTQADLLQASRMSAEAITFSLGSHFGTSVPLQTKNE